MDELKNDLNSEKYYENPLNYIQRAQTNLNIANHKVNILKQKIDEGQLTATFIAKQSIITIKNIFEEINKILNNIYSITIDDSKEIVEILNISDFIRSIDINIDNFKINLNKIISYNQNYIEDIKLIMDNLSKVSMLLVVVAKNVQNKSIQENVAQENNLNTIIHPAFNITEEKTNTIIQNNEKESLKFQKIGKEESKKINIIVDVPEKTRLTADYSDAMLKNNLKIKKANFKKFVLNTLLIVSFLGILISTYNMVMYKLDSNKTSKIITKINENVNVVETIENNQKYEIDFNGLKKINSDVVLWLKVNGTDIEFPVVKGKDNDYYLKHDLEKKNNRAGWIFVDYRDKLDGLDDNIIIYGHNMHDKTMFYSLKNVIKKEWYSEKENHKIILATEKDIFEYQVFSVYQINAQDYETITKYESKEKFANYLNFIRNNSVYDFGINVISDDQILTLSTCADNSNYRIVLHAKKIKK